MGKEDAQTDKPKASVNGNAKLEEKGEVVIGKK